MKKVVSDCDEAIVLLLQERAKATEMIAELRGPGNGMASAELSPEELDRIHRANTPGITNSSASGVLVLKSLKQLCIRLAGTKIFKTALHQACWY